MAQANQLMPGEWDNVFGPSVEAAQKTSDIAFETKTRANAGLDSIQRDYNSRVNMGRQIGKDINSLFGGKSTDPALRRAEIIDQIFKTLSPEELKNPANALSIIADRLEEDGLPRDATEARMQSIQLAQQQQLNENTVKDSNSKREVATLEKIARGANGILTSWDTQSPELQEQFYNIQVNMIAKELGEEAAAPYRNVKPSERKGILQGMVEQADNGAARSKEEIAQNRIVADQQRLEMKLEQDKTKFILSEANKFKRDMMKYRQQDKVEYTRNLSKTVNSLVDRLKIEQDNLEMYNDASKSPLLSEALRITNKNITNANILQIKKEIQEIGSMQMAAGERVYSPSESPTEWAAGTKTTTAPGATTASTSPAGTKTEYETNFANAQLALKNPNYNKAAILAEFKAKYPNDPQPTAPTAATVTPTPGAAPVANPAAQVQAKPEASKPVLSAEEQKKVDFEAAFLAKLNQETDWQKIGNAGKVVYNAINDFWIDYKDDLKAQGELTDKFAAYAKEKLADKAFVAKLGPNAKAKLQELAADSSEKVTKRQQDGAQTMLTLGTLVIGSGIAMPTAKGIIKVVAGKAAKSALKKENDAIPSSASAIEKNMETLKQTLLNKSEGARIAKLRSLGYKAEEAAKILKEMNLPIAGRSSKTGTPVLMQDTQKVPYTKPLFN
jgi:hypothetical protein